MNFRTLLILLVLSAGVLANLCEEKCECHTSNDTFVLYCVGRNMEAVIGEWPPHDAHLVASFAYNKLRRLEQMPPCEAETITLTFSHCLIVELESALFIDAPGITFLDLSWNFLTGAEIRADVFRGRYTNAEYEPIQLLELNLSHNNIESLRHTVFEHTPHLAHLDLSYNPLRVIDPQTMQSISSLLRLEDLRLTNTSIKNIPEKLLSRLQKLRRLDISWNCMRDEVPKALGYLGRCLEQLDISGNFFSYLDGDSFIGLHSLRQLNISNMPELKIIQHNTFATLTQLQVLDCVNNEQLSHIHQEAFGLGNKRPPLQELYLSGNDLETLSPSLLNWSHLQILDLTDNRWLCNCQLYETLQAISNALETTTETNASDLATIIKTNAMCAQPTWTADTLLSNLTGVKRACFMMLHQQKNLRRKDFLYHPFLRVSLLIMSFLLTMVACYVFWRVLIRYHNVRAMNPTYPVMYVTAPTSDN